MDSSAERRIVVTRNGPYEVYGPLPLMLQTIVADAAGTSREWQEGQHFEAGEQFLLCRCGQSNQKPFCDSSHVLARFDGTETASRAPYLEQAEIIHGPEMMLTDARPLCAYARFCGADGTIWEQIKQTDDPTKQEMVTREATHCPGGRLVAWSGQPPSPIEPDLEPSIGLVQDPARGTSGPLWVRGGVLVESADGTPYEVRNRVTLCRCGASGNKPFCDGSHSTVKFQDGLADPAAG